jgi:hypothetical protein
MSSSANSQMISFQFYAQILRSNAGKCDHNFEFITSFVDINRRLLGRSTSIHKRRSKKLSMQTISPIQYLASFRPHPGFKITYWHNVLFQVVTVVLPKPHIWELRKTHPVPGEPVKRSPESSKSICGMGFSKFSNCFVSKINSASTTKDDRYSNYSAIVEWCFLCPGISSLPYSSIWASNHA